MKKLILILVAFVTVAVFSCKDATSNKSEQSSGQGQGPKKKPTPPPASIADLTLVVSGSTVTVTISPNAQWAGIQKFVNMTTNDGAVSLGNWNFSTPPGVGTTKSIQVSGTGYYRGWTSDFDYTIHTSNVVFIP